MDWKAEERKKNEFPLGPRFIYPASQKLKPIRLEVSNGSTGFWKSRPSYHRREGTYLLWAKFHISTEKTDHSSSLGQGGLLLGQGEKKRRRSPGLSPPLGIQRSGEEASGNGGTTDARSWDAAGGAPVGTPSVRAGDSVLDQKPGVQDMGLGLSPPLTCLVLSLFLSLSLIFKKSQFWGASGACPRLLLSLRRWSILARSK